MTYYVKMVDKFLSGWGKATGKRSILCIECDTFKHAEAIEKAANDRSEMKYINIVDKPRFKKNDLVSHRKFSDMSGPWLGYWNKMEINY